MIGKKIWPVNEFYYFFMSFITFYDFYDLVGDHEEDSSWKSIETRFEDTIVEMEMFYFI